MKAQPVKGRKKEKAAERFPYRTHTAIGVSNLERPTALSASLHLVAAWRGLRKGEDQRVEIAMMRALDGHGRLEPSRFLTPPAVADHRKAP